MTKDVESYQRGDKSKFAMDYEIKCFYGWLMIVTEDFWKMNGSYIKRIYWKTWEGNIYKIW